MSRLTFSEQHTNRPPEWALTLTLTHKRKLDAISGLNSNENARCRHKGGAAFNVKSNVSRAICYRFALLIVAVGA